MPTVFLSILAGLAGVHAVSKLWAIMHLKRLLATPEGHKWAQEQVGPGGIVMPASRLPWIFVLAIVAAWFVALLVAP